MLRNIVDILADGHTAYYKRYNVEFPGPIIPFGAEVRYIPSSPPDIEQLHAFGEKMVAGLFMGYHQKAGGAWSGDLFVVNQTQVEQASVFGKIRIRRIPAKDVEVIKIGDKYHFPLKKY